MPNLSNITSPITLIAPGRSGTTLIGNLFARHPEFCSVGETVNLIYGAWHAVELAQLTVTSLPQNFHGDVPVTDDDLAARVARQACLTCYPDDLPRWFHKPIGIPAVLGYKFGPRFQPEVATWYWKIMRMSFPDAKYFTVLRHPCDVVLSAHAFWGYDEAGIWGSLGYLASLLTHVDSPVQYALRFDSLIQERERVVRELFDFLELPFRSEVLDAFSERYAAAKDRPHPNQHHWSRHDAWEKLDPAKAAPMHLQAIEALFAKFNVPLDWPAHFRAKRAAEDLPASGATESPIAKLEQRLRDQDSQIERLNRQIATREREYYTVWSQQQAWIAELERGKHWLDEQRLKWENLAKEREQTLVQLKARLTQLEKGTAS